MARWFFRVGGGLILLGLIVWALLPVKSGLPPFIVTGVLALLYSAFCWRRSRDAGEKKKP